MRESLAVAHEVRPELGPVAAVGAVAQEPPLVLPPRYRVRRGPLCRGGGRWCLKYTDMVNEGYSSTHQGKTNMSVAQLIILYIEIESTKLRRLLICQLTSSKERGIWQVFGMIEPNYLT